MTNWGLAVPLPRSRSDLLEILEDHGRVSMIAISQGSPSTWTGPSEIRAPRFTTSRGMNSLITLSMTPMSWRASRLNRGGSQGQLRPVLQKGCGSGQTPDQTCRLGHKPSQDGARDAEVTGGLIPKLDRCAKQHQHADEGVLLGECRIKR